MQSRNFGAVLKVALQTASLLFVIVAIAGPSAEAANARLPRTVVAKMAYASSVGARNGLPATTMDSFVANAVNAGKGDEIYGDEGQGEGIPKYFGFTARHRINAGIVGQQDAGLSTGHGSMLPDAWGRDEFLGLESSQGGYNGGAYAAVNTPNVQTVASSAMPAVAPSFAGASEYDLSATMRGATGAITSGANVSSANASASYGFGNAPTMPVSRTTSWNTYGSGLGTQQAAPAPVNAENSDSGF